MRSLLQRQKHASDRGSGAIAVVLFAPLVMFLAALIIDGGLLIHMRERANDLAEQSARYAANHIDQNALRNGGTVVVDQAACKGYVKEFADSSGLSIESTDCKPGPTSDSVVVTIELNYHPAIPLFYTDVQHAWGHATAKAVQQ